MDGPSTDGSDTFAGWMGAAVLDTARTPERGNSRAMVWKMIENPWAAENWVLHHGRPSLLGELALLARLFPLTWIRENLAATPRHRVLDDLRSAGGQTRLVFLAAELKWLMEHDARCMARAPRIPMEGRLRHWNLYEPTKSELLVGPLLRPSGDVAWQPEGHRSGADYKLSHESGALVAEVKRLCRTRRFEQIGIDRIAANPQHAGPVLTDEEHLASEREDRARLYKHVRHAADQLDKSARKAAREKARGVLFLDLDGNPYAVNLRTSIAGWMQLTWAQPIDLIMWFDFGSREGAWGAIAEPLFSRTGCAHAALMSTRERCDRGHLHIGNLPLRACAYQLPL